MFDISFLADAELDAIATIAPVGVRQGSSPPPIRARFKRPFDNRVRAVSRQLPIFLTGGADGSRLRRVATF
jgi:hypothetical protein